MKKQILSILLCALCVACNDFEEEIGYTLKVGPSKIIVDEISTTKSSYSGVYQIPISLVDGKADISKVYFEIWGERVEAKCGKNIYSMEYEFVFGKQYTVRTIALIDGVEHQLESRTVKYEKNEFRPNVVGIGFTVPELGKLRFTLTLSSSVGGYLAPVSDVTITAGSLTASMQSVDSKTYVYDADLYNIGILNDKVWGSVTTILGTQSYQASTGLVVYVNTSSYDMSNDGKEIDGCIYLAGTKWAKGVMGTDGQLTADSELGKSWSCYPTAPFEFDRNNEYHFQGTENDPVRKNLGEGWMTPSPTQIENLYRCCSIQEVKVGNNTGYLFYPGKNGKTVSCTVAYSADVKELRERGVYMQEKKYYASDCIYSSYNCATYRIKLKPSGTGYYLDDEPWSSKEYTFYILPIKE